MNRVVSGVVNRMSLSFAQKPTLAGDLVLLRPVTVEV